MIKYLTVDQVIGFHDDLLDQFGGLRGIRDKNLLHSALEAPKMAFGGSDMYLSVYDQAAAYLYHITKNHPFNDGNKRTAFVATLAFLKVNQARISFTISDLEEIVVEVANGTVTKTELAAFIESGKRPW